MRGASGGAVPEDHPLSEGYADREARRRRVDRLRAEAYQREWHRKWDEERARPIGERQFFSFAEIAKRLARDPPSLAIDPEPREQITADLIASVQNREFADVEVVYLGDDPPEFRPLEFTPLSGGVILLPDAEALALRRSACRRYVEARAELLGAASLLRDWFAVQPRARKPELVKAVQSVIEQHGHPCKTVPWQRFCDFVRTQCGVTASTRGYGDKTIKRTVQELWSEQDKSDIGDMSDMSR
jgi:hypothetical protein